MLAMGRAARVVQHDVEGEAVVDLRGHRASPDALEAAAGDLGLLLGEARLVRPQVVVQLEALALGFELRLIRLLSANSGSLDVVHYSAVSPNDLRLTMQCAA